MNFFFLTFSYAESNVIWKCVEENAYIVHCNSIQMLSFLFHFGSVGNGPANRAFLLKSVHLSQGCE